MTVCHGSQRKILNLKSFMLITSKNVLAEYHSVFFNDSSCCENQKNERIDEET